MDFDKVNTAKVYDRARWLPPETWVMWKKILMQAVPKQQVKTVVDLGTGTGRFLGFLQKTFSAEVFGIDPSKKMLAQAKKNSKNNTKIKLIRGSSEKIPLKDGSADLVFISLAFHHFNNLDKSLREIKRILRPGGFVAIRQPTKEDAKHDQVLSFFPESRKMAMDMVTTRPEMLKLWQGAGFKKHFHKIVKQKVSLNCKQFYERVSLRGAVIFKLIPDKIFNHRLKQLHNYCNNLKRDHAFYEIRELFVFQKPKA